MKSHSNEKKDLNVVLQQQKELPHDVITQNILTRLPIKLLVQFKSVSKQWYSTLSSPHFAYSHFKSPYFSPTQSLLLKSNNNKFHFLCYENGGLDLVDFGVDFDVGNEILILVGTCNGLVCLGSISGYLFVLWNPITREFRKYLDHEMSNFSIRGWMVTWGFGYLSDVDDYKIVRICKKVKGRSFTVDVFSIRSNKWRKIDDDSCNDFSDLRTTEHLYRPGVVVNETLYWMGGVPPILEESNRKVLSFDLDLELFNTFEHLEVCTPSTWLMAGECMDEFLCVAKGCLSKYGRFVRNGEGVITMLKSPGETEQIVLSRDVVSSACKNVIGFEGSDKIFTKYYGSHVPQLGVIDLSSRPWKHTPLMSLEIMSEITSYSASLISPIVVTRMSEDEDEDEDENTDENK